MKNISLLFLITSYVLMYLSTPAWADTSSHTNSKADPHAHHKAMMKNTNRFKRSTQKYSIPKLTLLDKMGIKTPTTEIFDSNKTQMVNFIFTTCNTICPVLSGTFSQVDNDIIKQNKNIELISITIDPEFDRPKILKGYGEKFKSSSKWKFFTGSREDIVTLQTAFNAYRGSKMNHEPITLLRKANTEEWTRIDGFASAKDLISEIKE